MEATFFAAGSTINVKQKLFDQSHHAEAYTNKVEWSTQYTYCNRMGGTKIFKGRLLLLLSCDNVLNFIGAANFLAVELFELTPGHFSYGLEVT